MTTLAAASATSPARIDMPPTATFDERWPIELLWESEPRPNGAAIRGGTLPTELQARYGADLRIALRGDRPTLIANFVATVDGVVALDAAGQSSGREISGAFEPDRFLMGLLRATSDAVVVGAGTVRASRTGGWAAADVHRASTSGFAAWRRELDLREAVPTTVVVTGSGDLEPGQIPADPDVPVILATTAAGARQLSRLPRRDHVEIVSVSDTRASMVEGLVDLLGERGFELILAEGGPTLFGELLSARLVDELFLTVAPQVAGRSDRTTRLGLVEDAGFTPDVAPWGRLRSVMRSADYLFLRYGLPSTDRKDAS
jgi:riboflavin biosynthesis pyrimidine reductase